MKSMVALFLLVSSVCFSYTGETEWNLIQAWDAEANGESQLSLEFLTRLIDDPEVSKLDKVHYINARGSINFNNALKEKYLIDLNILKELCIKNPECDKEMWEYYEYSFTVNILDVPIRR